MKQSIDIGISEQRVTIAEGLSRLLADTYTLKFEDPQFPLERHRDQREDTDCFSQPGALFRLMTVQQQQTLFENTARSIGEAPHEVQLRHLRHCVQADAAYDEGVANALGVAMNELG